MGFNIFDSKVKEALNNGGGFISLSDINGYQNISDGQLYKEGWLSNEDVMSVVSRLANLVSSLPIVLMNGDDPVQDTDPIFKKFYDEWNTKRGLNPELYLYVLNILIYGRAYIYKNAPIGIPSKSDLWTLNSYYVTPQGNYDYFSNPEYYNLDTGKTTQKIFYDEIIEINNYSLEKSYETEYVSPLQSVWKSVIAGNNRADAEAAMLENRGIAGFIAPKSSSGDASLIGFMDSTMKAIREKFSSLVGGAKKFNKVEVIEQASEFVQIGMSSQDLELVKSRLNHIRSICNVYNVPSLLFNDYQSRTHANYGEAMKAIYNDAVLPLFDKWNAAFQKDFLNDINEKSGANYYVKVDKSEIEALNKSVIEVLKSLPQNLSSRMVEQLDDAEIRALMLELGIIKQ